MGLVEKHLQDITIALGEIEQHLKQAVNAQEHAVTSEGRKRSKMVNRVIRRAEELIETCDNYFSLVAAIAPVSKTEADETNNEGDKTIQPRY